MTPELDQHIIEKYPLIFSQPCDIGINDGWFDIIDMLCANIQNRIDNAVTQRQYAIEWNEDVNDPDFEWTKFGEREERKVPELVEQVVAKQIKEKFGTLRFYYDGGDDYIRGLEAMAASMTSRICEQCGCPGTSRSTKKQRWVLVLCDKHAVEQGYIEDEDSISE
jgi:hypothetical protein